jgi:hypothetical protein
MQGRSWTVSALHDPLVEEWAIAPAPNAISSMLATWRGGSVASAVACGSQTDGPRLSDTLREVFLLLQLHSAN